MRRTEPWGPNPTRVTATMAGGPTRQSTQPTMKKGSPFFSSFFSFLGASLRDQMSELRTGVESHTLQGKAISLRTAYAAFRNGNASGGWEGGEKFLRLRSTPPKAKRSEKTTAG